MKTKSIAQLAAALLLSTLNSQLSTGFAQGSLTPPGAPAPTMKSLDQIEARTPISSAPFTISQPGSYYLTANVSVGTGFGIKINTNQVTLDLNGFTISSTAPSAVGNGVLLASSAGNSDITILNGHIKGGVTNSDAGVFGGGGFANGIFYSGGTPYNVRVSGTSVSGVLSDGIYLGTGNSTVVESCTVTVAGNYGIHADSVSDSTALNCGSRGINASTAHNCKGYGVGSAIGLEADTANNCYGYSSGSGTGLNATTASNCYGFSSTGDGLFAFTASNCYGATNGSGIGLGVDYVATGCLGFSSSGTGLAAFIASVSHGDTSTGTALSVTHNVNSY